MYPPAPAAAQPPSPPPILARIGITGWRLVVAGCAFFGVYTVADDPMLGWRDLWFLSQLGSLVAAVVYLLLAPIPLLPVAERLEPAAAWVRGSLASMMLLICIASIFILGSGDLDQIGFLFEHLLTPLIIAADFVLVGRFSARSKAWHPLTWIGMPLLYLVLLNVAGEASTVYGGILEPANSEFAMYVGMFLVTAIVFGYILFGLAKLRGLVAGSVGGQPVAAYGAPVRPQQPGAYGPAMPVAAGYPAAAPYGQVPQAPYGQVPQPAPSPYGQAPQPAAAGPYAARPDAGPYASVEGEYGEPPLPGPNAGQTQPRGHYGQPPRQQ